MPIHRSKSRVQFRVATKKTEKQKAVITEEKHPKIKAPTGSKAVPKDSGIAPKAYRRKPIVRFASEDDEVEDVIYEDSDEDEGMFNFELSPSLCKKQLPTTEETKGMGVLKGNIKATMTATTTSPTVEYDWPEDPPASLILDLPVYVQSGEQLQFALTIQPPAPFQKAPSSNSRSALQTVVDLFAGQKKPPTVKKIGDKNYREVTRGPTNSKPGLRACTPDYPRRYIRSICRILTIAATTSSHHSPSHSRHPRPGNDRPLEAPRLRQDQSSTGASVQWLRRHFTRPLQPCCSPERV